MKTQALAAALIISSGLLSACGLHFDSPPRTNAVALADLDGDGDLDAFWGNSFSVRDAQGTMSHDEPNTVWLNNGTGHFTDSGQRLGRSDTQAVALGEVDGDGDLDAFVGNSGADEVWLNDGLGNFTDSGQVLGSTHTQYAALGELDGDGDLDAVVGSETAGEIWLNDGTGHFQVSRQRLAYSSRHAVALGDVVLVGKPREIASPCHSVRLA